MQQLDTGEWELFLEERAKGRIALSESGSGFKTLLLVLAYLWLLPHFEKNSLSQYIFAFEEPENNLHPAIQRRLLHYLHGFASKHGCRIILTTHSSTAIDFLSTDESSQILHISHSGSSSTVTRATTSAHAHGVLDDLDIRASDLLQANGIVWVEGPSDRIYLKRWLDLVSDGILREGIDYQCLFYGGRLLSHLSAADPSEANEAIAVLRANRNAAVLIDSDRSMPSDKLNHTKKRIIEEFATAGLLWWVTHGREIENYLCSAVLKRAFALTCEPKAVGPYQRFGTYLKPIEQRLHSAFQASKSTFATTVAPHIEKFDIERFDLREKLSELATIVAAWNGKQT